MKKNDLILIGAILAIALMIFAGIKLFSPKGKKVVVEADGAVYATLELDSDTTLVINSENGTNTLVIEDSKAYVTDADCRDKICEHTGRISEVGELIVCLPNKVIITIEDE